MTNNEDQKKKPSGPPHVSDLILGSLKPRTGKETSKWIAGLADNTIKDAAEAAAREMEAIPTPSGAHQALRHNSGKQAVVMFTDQLFDHFQQYEFDFNRTVAGTDYVISIERPIFSTEQVRARFAATETVKVFKGRVSTRYWTLIIRAYNETIEAWILPVEAIFSFRADDERLPPYITIEPIASRAGELNWNVNGIGISVERTPALSKQIFGALIRKARGEMPENETFLVAGEKPDLRSTGEIVNPPTQPVVSSGMPYSYNQSGSSTGRGLPLGSTQLQGQPESMLHQQDRFQAQSGHHSLLQQPDPVPLQQPTTKSPKQTLTKTRKQSAAAAQGQFAGEPTVDAAIAALNAAVNKELEKLSIAGAEAFSKQDMVLVEQIFRKTTKVRDLHSQMSTLLEQWKRAFQEAIDS
ncbi:MAG TPA: hypothetical protein V6D22_14355 [Candidatus Obscuribacterales bacterium]